MIYLIDFENVHEEGFASLGRLGDRDAVYCFFTKNVAKISMAALAGMRSGQLHFIEAESGKQSLDLALVSYLGYLIGTVPNEQCYEIVSNDNGFAKAAEFWNKHRPGIRVRVRKTVDQTKTETKAPAKSSSRRTSKSSKAAAPASVSAAPVTEAKPSPQPAPAPAEKPASKPTDKAAPAPVKSPAALSEGAAPAESLASPSGGGGAAAPERVNAAAAKSTPAPVKSSVSLSEGDVPAGTEGVNPAAATKSTSTRSKKSGSRSKANSSGKSAAKTAPEKPDAPLSEEVAPAKSPASLSEGGVSPGTEGVAPAKSASTPTEKPAFKPAPSAIAALGAAGIEAPVAEFLLTQADKYRDDKNIKQLVYRAVIKKYGQKQGTQIYNTAKKVAL